MEESFPGPSGVPDLHRAHLGESSHPFPVAANATENRLACGRFVETVAATGDEKAGRQPFDIPFPGRRQSFVKIVDVEDDPSFRCGERSKVHQVSVSTALNSDSRIRRLRKIGRHDRRRAAVEDKRGGDHSSITDRNQLWKPSLIGCFQNLDGVYAVCRRLPFRMTQPGAGIAVRLALHVELLPRARPRHDWARNFVRFVSNTVIFRHKVKPQPGLA
jgi:hypothetical protein